MRAAVTHDGVSIGIEIKEMRLHFEGYLVLIFPPDVPESWDARGMMKITLPDMTIKGAMRDTGRTGSAYRVTLVSFEIKSW